VPSPAKMPVLMDEILAAEGGWTGWRSVTVVERIRVSSHITSFILTPQDGHPVLRHKPGRYVTFRLKADGAPERKRNSSISYASNGKYSRVSAKRKAAGQGGPRFLHGDI